MMGVEVNTDEDETPACTPLAQPRAEGESLATRVQRKRRWEGGAEKGQQREAAALKRKRPLKELCSRPKQKARRLVLPASSTETGRAAEGRNSPSSGEDGSARTAERSPNLPAPKARTPSVEARRPSGQEKQYAAPTNVPATDRCFASEQVPFDDSTSGQEPSAQAPSAQQKSRKEPSGKAPWAQEPSAEAPSAQGPSAQGNSGQRPSVTEQAGGAGLSGTGSPTALDILEGSSVAAAAAEATQPNSRESPGNSVTTEIFNSENDEDESGSEEEEE
ncbi:hypothetical protein AXG93_2035s1810 [Marchantia polymorpha subsp. ruderalis]|uniref:Uncharacterized protein n=1 Tax=Marchantia polymorpha subsp. ruderalis TaxID=1480154 RepID=A0A176VQ62_MARPO|nr:hypothetical protein AXG93_2035s1810 [Marchantia polymorpha subsp. ruderalis]